jgi:LmbE family N-acetylglucosaminyl deacetylase
VVKGLPVNCLWAERQAVWQAIWDVVESFDPDLVVTVAADLHQDHETVHNETMRACAGRSVLSYGILPSHPATFSGKYYEVLEEEDIAAKVHAVGLYAPCSASSGLNKVRYEDKAYMQPGVIWAQAKVAAISTGSPLAEVLSVERLVM